MDTTVSIVKVPVGKNRHVTWSVTMTKKHMMTIRGTMDVYNLCIISVVEHWDSDRPAICYACEVAHMASDPPLPPPAEPPPELEEKEGPEGEEIKHICPEFLETLKGPGAMVCEKLGIDHLSI